MKYHEDKITVGSKLTIDASPLALVAKEEVTKVNKSKEKVVVVADSHANNTYDQFTSEDKAIMVSNPKKIFKKFFQILEIVETQDLMVEVYITKVETHLLVRRKLMVL